MDFESEVSTKVLFQPHVIRAAYGRIRSQHPFGRTWIYGTSLVTPVAPPDPSHHYTLPNLIWPEEGCQSPKVTVIQKTRHPHAFDTFSCPNLYVQHPAQTTRLTFQSSFL